MKRRTFFDVQCGERPHTVTPCERRLILREFALAALFTLTLAPIAVLAIAAVSH